MFLPDPGGPTLELVVTSMTLSVVLARWLLVLFDSIKQYLDSQSDKPKVKVKLTVDIEIN
ncbi:MAG: hypothetical protein OHK0022_08230 [Roseiflexaceae bacterium]